MTIISKIRNNNFLGRGRKTNQSTSSSRCFSDRFLRRNKMNNNETSNIQLLKSFDSKDASSKQDEVLCASGHTAIHFTNDSLSSSSAHSDVVSEHSISSSVSDNIDCERSNSSGNIISDETYNEIQYDDATCNSRPKRSNVTSASEDPQQLHNNEMNDSHDNNKLLDSNYFPEPQKPTIDSFDSSAPVFFMIGSQRSGSNWLRTMLGEREDLAGPHPPHILRDFMPILPKFGDLEVQANLEVLVDHVCTFVERNQVTWFDKHGQPIIFDRKHILTTSIETVQILRTVQEMKNSPNFIKQRIQRRRSTAMAESEEDLIDQRYYLLAIFDEIMNTCAIRNDKQTWICKSMGMSQFHDMLLTFYGKERLRYIYLVRDVRDVALSFMKTPVGDCHYYRIVKKWCKLQDHALRILSDTPELVHQVRYESLLQDKEGEISEINDFIGHRKTGKVMRRGSVVVLKDDSEIVNSARSSRESMQASVLSYQFRNLIRGDSFSKHQFQKWRKELSDENLLLVESIAHTTMSRLGYVPHLVGKSKEALSFTEEDIERFNILNEEGIKKMNEDLVKENPDDAMRRKIQAAVLQAEPILFNHGDRNNATNVDLTEEASEINIRYDAKTSLEKQYPYNWPYGASKFGYLKYSEVLARLHVQEENIYDVKDGFKISFSAATQRGYYPNTAEKDNQDKFVAKENWFGVYDGHGKNGDRCASFVREELIKKFTEKLDSSADGDAEEILKMVHLDTNESLLSHPSIDADTSGTTAVTLYMDGRDCIIANVGDSRCVFASRAQDGRQLEAKAYTTDHTPYRNDELERIKQAGGLVMTSNQYDKTEPMHEEWKQDDETQHEPPRIWSPQGRYPGTAFTRSIGDKAAESLGVYAQPEITTHRLMDDDTMFILGSDGIFEFISDQEAVNIASVYSNPTESCRALIGESYKRWIKSEDRTDDITVIVGFISRDRATNSIPVAA